MAQEVDDKPSLQTSFKGEQRRAAQPTITTRKPSEEQLKTAQLYRTPTRPNGKQLRVAQPTKVITYQTTT